MTTITWSGTDCIPIRTVNGQRDLCDIYQHPPSEAVVEHGKAIGDLVGVDPVLGHADWVSCEVRLNGSLYFRSQHHHYRPLDQQDLHSHPSLHCGS